MTARSKKRMDLIVAQNLKATDGCVHMDFSLTNFTSKIVRMEVSL